MESAAIEHQSIIVKRRLEAHANELRTAARRREVLDEDDFVGRLDSIIQRDFFPELPRLRAQLELLDALDAGDTQRARKAFALIATPGAASTPAAVGPPDRSWTPASVSEWGDATPRHERAGGATPSARGAAGAAASTAVAAAAAAAAAADELPRLDRFLSKHTSEDNASFAVILNKDQVEHRKRTWWMQDGKAGAMIKMHPQQALTHRGEAPLHAFGGGVIAATLTGVGPGGAGTGAAAGWSRNSAGQSVRVGGDGAASASASEGLPLLGLRGSGGTRVAGSADPTPTDEQQPAAQSEAQAAAERVARITSHEPEGAAPEPPPKRQALTMAPAAADGVDGSQPGKRAMLPPPSRSGVLVGAGAIVAAPTAAGAIVGGKGGSGGGAMVAAGGGAVEEARRGPQAFVVEQAGAREWRKQGSLDNDTRPSVLQFHRFSHRNELMFVPDAHPTQPEMAGPPTIIVPHNTRLPNANAPPVGAPSQDTAVAGAPPDAPLDAAAAVAAAARGGLAALRGYAMVDPSPSPMPGAGGESPMMTWGSVLGAPFRLSDGEVAMAAKSQQEFKIPEMPYKERITHRLAGDAGRRLRARTPKGSSAKLPGGGTAPGRRVAPPPGGGGGAKAAAGRPLSAAGMRLASALAGGDAQTPRGSSSLAQELRRSYTPGNTPKRSHAATPKAASSTPKLLTPRPGKGATPSRGATPSGRSSSAARPAPSSAASTTAPAQGAASITDGLLHL